MKTESTQSSKPNSTINSKTKPKGTGKNFLKFLLIFCGSIFLIYTIYQNLPSELKNKVDNSVKEKITTGVQNIREASSYQIGQSIVCVFCKGNGKYLGNIDSDNKCNWCNGSGQLIIKAKEKCIYCNGLGIISCISCKGSGKAHCTACDGYGREDSGNGPICTLCGGSGIGGTCPFCNGSSTMNCLMCDGTGMHYEYEDSTTNN